MTNMKNVSVAAPRLGLGLGLGLSLGLLPVAAADQVSKVVVYPDRAQVTRSTQVACGERVMVKFAAIPPAADPGSVRAQVGLPGARILGVRSEELVRGGAYAQKVEELDEKIRLLSLEIAALRDEQERDQQALSMAARYEEVAVAQVGREMVDPQPQGPKAWTTALDTALKARLDAAAGQSERGAKQRDLTRKYDELVRTRRQNQLAATRKELLAEVLIACPPEAGAQKTDVEVTYMVGGAGWSPAHEARLSEPGGTVELSSYATVTQHTGEDWNGAKLVVSTAIPRQNATPPELSPLRVSATERTPPKKMLVSRTEEQRHAEASGSTTPTTGKAERGPALVEQGLSVQFVSATPADVRGDGTPARLRVARSELAGAIRYRTVPKLQPFVFRVADLVNTAGYPLLPGPIDVFRRGQFMARYDLERVAAGERFHLSFGLVDRVRVRRHVVEEIARDRGVFGSTRRTRYAYRFEIESHLPGVEEIELAEHVPVAELDEVKVGFDPKATPGYELRAADGIVTYRLRMSPNEKRTVDLAYYVDAPASMLE